MYYLILDLSLYIFLISYSEKEFVNLGDSSMNEDQRTKLFKAFKPFMQILSLSLATIGLTENYNFGEDARGLFIRVYYEIFLIAFCYVFALLIKEVL